MGRDWRDDLDAGQRKLLERRAMPEWIEPMLATLTDKRFSDPDWIFERKLDGERCIARHDGSAAHLFTRNHKSLDATYPEIRERLAGQPHRCIVDGELVAFSGKVTDFSRLQQRMQLKDVEQARASDVAVYYYIFDLLYLDHWDLRKLSLRRRKQLLRNTFGFDHRLRFTPHRNEAGETAFEDACKRGWEGLIAKRADGGYRNGRSRDWLKFKCAQGQELVVVGFTDPQGSRSGFGALLLGYHEDGTLRYAGRVGTGFDERTLEALHARLTRIEQPDTPIDSGQDLPDEGVHWVRPELVAEIGFTEWTRAGRLRHPRFLGLRDDKPASSVVRERAQ